jgi:hypothetical protein
MLTLTSLVSFLLSTQERIPIKFNTCQKDKLDKKKVRGGPFLFALPLKTFEDKPMPTFT